MNRIVTMVSNTAVLLKFAMTADLKCSHIKNEKKMVI